MTLLITQLYQLSYRSFVRCVVCYVGLHILVGQTKHTARQHFLPLYGYWLGCL